MSNRQRTAWGLPPARRPIGGRKYRKPHLTVESLDGRILPSASLQQFDFGTYGSYNQSGYTRVTQESVYTATAGYGWLSGNVAGTDRGSVGKNDLSFNFTTDATFGVALPSGNYVVTVTANDPTAVHDLMGVSAEGQLRGWLTMTRDLREVRASYTVSVTDGMLNLRLHDLGGNDRFAIINGLEIVAAATPPQATFAGTGAAEGSPGQVTFTNPTGGAGPYTYSVDFNNDGTFEVIAGSNATVTVPASFLPDGPGTVVVHGRITDANGMFRDYTTSLAVTNVPPSVTLATTLAGATNAPIQFTPTVTDPSPVDRAAGFTYAWDFGDGTASTQAAPSHAYSATGTYTARVTVRDKDGGLTTKTSTVTVTPQAPPGAFIVTGSDRIPNFGAQPTITSARSGLWSDPGTWSAGRVPVAGDIVSVTAWNDVTYDIVSTEAIKTVAVQANGRLLFRTDVNTKLTVINLLIMEGGELRIGTAANPVAANVKAEVVFADVALDLVNDPAQYGNGLIALGKVTMYGAVKNQTFGTLATEPHAGDTTLALSAPANGWRVGDRLVLPDSRQLRNNERNWGGQPNQFTSQLEIISVAAISADGRTITLTAPLQHNHLGARDGDGALTFLPYVANLTRNVVVRSANANGVRGHTLYTSHADVDIEYAQFAGLGRTRLSFVNNTQFDAAGNVTQIGTNQTGRYSVNFTHLYGSATPPAGGYQYTFKGNSVFCPIDPMPFRWGINVQDSHYGLIQDNVLYNWAGAGIMTQAGNESYNVIDHNFITRIIGTGSRADAGERGTSGRGLWLAGPNNYVRNNVISNVGTGQNEQQYGIAVYANIRNANLPAYQGADPTVSGQRVTVDLGAMPLRQFDNNEIYGATARGFEYWYVNSREHVALGNGESTIGALKIWGIHEMAVFGYYSNRVAFDGLILRGDFSQMANAPQGVYLADYVSKDFVIRNSDIQGMAAGFIPSSHSGGGLQTIRDSFMRNKVDVQIGDLWTSAGSSDWVPARTVIVRNVRFVAPPGLTSQAIATVFPDSYAIQNRSTNLIQLNRVLVYDYNGNVGLNFQVYFQEQAPDYVLPQSTYELSGRTRRTASPVAGLTNQQAWQTYGIALAGEIAPTNQTMAGIDGFVRIF